MKKLFLVDAYALIFKYYYAFLGRPMRNRAGMNTSVVFGFVKFLRDIQKRERPDLLGVAFDPKGGSFRREVFPEYKANRAETPEDILLSVPYVKRVLEAMCIPILEVEGYEADDVIGTLSQKGVEAGYEVFMDRIVGMSLAVNPFEAWYIPFKEENTAEYTEIVRPLFENDRIAKIGQNIKFDLMVLRQLGLEIRGRKYDTMIQGQAGRENRRVGR